MRRHLRLIVMTLLLALPLQALASASMLCCGRDAHGAALEHFIETAGIYTADDQAAHDQFNQRVDADNHAYDSDHDAFHHLAGSCGVCADCCCPATLTNGDAGTVAFGDRYSTLIPYIDQPLSGPAPDRLDRPPRSILV
jgi:hypothetical protein